MDAAQPMSIHLSLDQAPDTQLQPLGEVLHLNGELVLPSLSSHHLEVPKIRSHTINALEDSTHIKHVITECIHIEKKLKMRVHKPWKEERELCLPSPWESLSLMPNTSDM